MDLIDSLLLVCTTTRGVAADVVELCQGIEGEREKKRSMKDDNVGRFISPKSISPFSQITNR